MCLLRSVKFVDFLARALKKNPTERPSGECLATSSNHDWMKRSMINVVRFD